MIGTSQVIYHCLEHENVDVPISRLMDSAGRLKVYPEVSSGGWFDIDFHSGRLSLRSKRFVGLIPISDEVAIHVKPKAPISNLLRMIWRAGIPLDGLSTFIRGYQERPGEVDDPESLYVTTFLNALGQMHQRGPLKRYVAEQSDTARRGRLLFAPTISRYSSKGIRRRHAFEFHELTVDNPENRVLKHTAERLLKKLSQFQGQLATETVHELRRLLATLSLVDSSLVRREFVARSAIRMIRSLPTDYRFYEPALWLSYLIATNSGVIMERVGRARFESVIIDTSSVFEKYVRKLFQEAATSHFGGCQVLNGNVHQLRVFPASRQFIAQPDYYFQKDRQFVAVADAKYKPKVEAEDRYALLAYGQILNVTKTAFVCPKFGDEPATLHQGTTRGGVEVYVVRIALDAADLPAEELAFKARVATALGM